MDSADGAALPAKTGVDDAVLPAAMSDEAVPPLAWDFAKLALSTTDCTPVLGDAGLWPDLTVSAAAAKGKAPASSSTCSKTTAAVAEHAPQRAAGSTQQNPSTASTHRHRGRGNSGAAMEPSPMHAPNNRERCAPTAPEQQQTPNNRSNNSNNTGFRGHHQSGRFVAHPHHGRGGEGYNRGGGGGGGGEGYNRGGNRRPVGGANNGRRDASALHANANGDAGRNRGGGWHRQEHRGGFNGGQPRGRGHQQDAHRGPQQWPFGRHRPFGPPMDYVQAPPHGMMHHPPPFMAGMAPPMPMPMPPPCYYVPPVPYGPYGYPYPEFVPGCFAPPQFMPEALPPFMQYPASQMHMMHTNLEQQAAGPSQLEPQQQQHAPEQPLQLQGQQALPNQENEQEQNPERLRQEIRQQIEFYFSADNLRVDMYLREHMDNQGWVPLTLIAGFYLICSRTNDMALILEAILTSNEVEVQDGRVRKRVGWEEYPLPQNN